MAKEIDIVIGLEKFKEKSDIAKEVNKIDFLIERLEERKRRIEMNLKFINNLREIYFMEYISK